MLTSTSWRKALLFALPFFLLANLYLLFLREYDIVFPNLGKDLYLLLMVYLTVRVTRPVPVDAQGPTAGGFKLWLQIAVLLVVMVLTGMNSKTTPVWSDIVGWFYNLGEALLPKELFGGPGNSFANPVQYFVIPFLLLIWLGARPAELGFRAGHKSWQVCLVWLALPALLWVVLLGLGSLPVMAFIRLVLANSFQNGFFEEFLYRGALQTRLQRLVATPWAITIQALLFGLWHLRANTVAKDGNVLIGLALCVVAQALAGLVFGLVFHRTRNLLAPSLAHVVWNMTWQSLSYL